MNEAEHDGPPETGLLLDGLDGANPLAFLAALGTLRGLSIAWPGRAVQLSWVARDTWRPRLHVDHATPNREDVLAGLEVFMDARPGHEALGIGDNPAVAPDLFRRAAYEAAVSSSPSPAGRSRADFLAGLGCDAATDRNRKDVIQDTALRTMQGTGHQHFLKTMRDLSERTTADSIARCLFAPWTRGDEHLSLRWDPEEDRRYALRWRAPTREVALTEWGANRLAFEAIPLLPVAPVGTRLATTGFRGTRATDTYFTWPIWDAPVGLDTLRSVLSMADLQEDAPNRGRLAAMGIREVFRSQRINVDRYRNFSPARSV